MVPDRRGDRVYLHYEDQTPGPAYQDLQSDLEDEQNIGLVVTSEYISVLAKDNTRDVSRIFL